MSDYIPGCDIVTNFSSLLHAVLNNLQFSAVYTGENDHMFKAGTLTFFITILNNTVKPESGVPMLNNIVDNYCDVT